MAKKRGLTRASVLSLQLGPTAAQVKLKASAKQWKSFKKAAHARGLSMEDYFKGTPKALAPKTRGQIQAEAKTLMNSAYAPAETDLNTRESQVKAIAAKRERDDAYYRDWLSSQTGQIASDITASNKLITDKITGADDVARAGYAQAATNAAANVAANAGVTQNVSGGTAMQQIPVAAGIADVKRTGESARELTGAALSSGMVAATHANSLASYAANEAKRTAETWAALSEIAGDRTKLKLDKASKVAQEVSRLMDQEITKASGNRDYGALLDKLDLQRVDLKIKGQKNRSDARDKAADRKETKRWHDLQNSATIDAQTYKENKDSADRSTKRAEFIAKYGKTPEQWLKMTDAERLSWTKRYNTAKSKSEGGKNGLTPGQKLKNIQTANQFISAINTLSGQIKIKVDPKTKKVKITNTRKLIEQGYSQEMIDAAYDIHEGKKVGSAHPLSAKSRRYAKRILKGYGQNKLPADW